MEHIINVSGLRKSYGDIQAVRGISFSVREGMLFAFLGPNGAGKSTTIDILCTILKPGGGEVTVNGFELGRNDDGIRASIGVVFQDRMLDDLLTVRENLDFRASFYNLTGRKAKAAVEAAAKAAGADEFMSQRYGKLSGGQKRRADIARALINTPKILFLDEPTTGLDPQTRSQVWESIRNLQTETGVTVFLTTHYMEEAAGADYVAIIKKGEIAATGTPAQLKQEYGSDVLRLVARDEAAVTSVLDGIGATYKKNAGMLSVPVKSSMYALSILDKVRNDITGFEMVNGTMDDVFLSIIGNGTEENLNEHSA